LWIHEEIGEFEEGFVVMLGQCIHLRIWVDISLHWAMPDYVRLS
jgi:hypothetical protein